MEQKKHRILREALRRYQSLETLFKNTGNPVLRITDDIEISFLDIKDGLEKLSPRKREAIYYNVILDMKQKDVAEIMGITTVSVGQYVESGFMQFAEEYFEEEEDNSSPRRRRRKKSGN